MKDTELPSLDIPKKYMSRSGSERLKNCIDTYVHALPSLDPHKATQVVEGLLYEYAPIRLFGDPFSAWQRVEDSIGDFDRLEDAVRHDWAKSKPHRWVTSLYDFNDFINERLEISPLGKDIEDRRVFNMFGEKFTCWDVEKDEFLKVKDHFREEVEEEFDIGSAMDEICEGMDNG